MEDKKETVGKIATDLIEKGEHNPDVIAQQREMLKDYENQVLIAVENGKRQFNGDFYVVVSTKKEKLLQNVIRNYFYPRESCPSPQHDQIVYRYIRREDMFEIIWVLPNKQACEIYRNDPINVPKEERDLLLDILSYYDGSLLKKCMELNKGIKESSLSPTFDPAAFDDQENHRIIS